MAKLLTQDDVARRLKLKPRTLEGWRLRGVGPKFIRLSNKCVRYRLDDFNEYLASHLEEGHDG